MDSFTEIKLSNIEVYTAMPTTKTQEPVQPRDADKPVDGFGTYCTIA